MRYGSDRTDQERFVSLNRLGGRQEIELYAFFGRSPGQPGAHRISNAVCATVKFMVLLR
jgi:hypothetical protein